MTPTQSPRTHLWFFQALQTPVLRTVQLSGSLCFMPTPQLLVASTPQLRPVFVLNVGNGSEERAPGAHDGLVAIQDFHAAPVGLSEGARGQEGHGGGGRDG